MMLKAAPFLAWQPGTFMRLPWCCAQVNVDNIDRDLFGRNVRGAMYQPVDETLDKYKKAAHEIVRAIYADNVVREPLFFLLLTQDDTLASHGSVIHLHGRHKPPAPATQKLAVHPCLIMGKTWEEVPLGAACVGH